MDAPRKFAETISSPTQSMADAARYYTEALQWGVVSIPPGTKGPNQKGWNKPGGYFTDPIQAAAHWRQNPRRGMGLVHAPSGTASLDVDNLGHSQTAFQAIGYNLDDLLSQGLGIIGNPVNKAKAIFRVPQGITLETLALSWPSQQAGGKPVKILELRAGSVQDVLPPTIHPDTKQPYRWITPPWEVKETPELPSSLLALWTRWEVYRSILEEACPWKHTTPMGAPEPSTVGNGGSSDWNELRIALRQRVSIEEMLARMGAEKRGAKYLCPFHQEREASFWTFVKNEGPKWYCAHGGAPVGRDTSKGGSSGDVVDLYQFYTGLASPGDATRDLAEELGIELPRNGKGSHEKKDSKPSPGKTPEKTGTAGQQGEEPPDLVLWPDPPDEAAFYGLAGEFVRAIDPHTEADPMALLVQFLVAFGNVVGRGPYFVAEADRHYPNLFTVLAGVTSKGRKGTSWGHNRRVFGYVDQEWEGKRVMSGLSSGEGVIWVVRDPIWKTEAIKEKGRHTGEYQEVMVDQGIEDKRLLVIEAEFASTLRVLGREGNTLSALIRQAWDTGNLRIMTKNSPAQATEAHISIIGHITNDELRAYLSQVEAANGFGNRYLFVCVRRSKYLPEGGRIDTVNFGPMTGRLHQAIEFAKTVGEVRRDEEARQTWLAVYPTLSAGRPGLFGAVTARAEAQVMRLAMIYALLDQSSVIRKAHLAAALAFWEYCENSARFIFGDALGDPTADEILQALREAPKGLTRTEIRDLFGRHKEAKEITQALTALLSEGLIRKEAEATAGRPVERWLSVRATATKAI